MRFAILKMRKLVKRVELGPYARIRPGSRLARNVKMGNFVEVKNAHWSKVPK